MKPLNFPTHSLYVYGVAIATIIAMAIAWYILHTVFAAISACGTSIIHGLETNSTYTDNVETFFSNVDTYILIVMLIVVVVWALLYSQRRGVPVYG